MVRPKSNQLSALISWLGADAEARLQRMRRQLLMFFSRRRVPPSDAEELTQNALTTLVEKSAGPNPPPYDSPEQLLMGIAKNLLLRYRGRPVVVGIPVEAVDAGRVEGARPEIAETARMRCLDRCLSELSDDQRRVLEAYYMFEREPSDIANDLNVTSSALRVRVHRAKRALLKKIEECLEKGGGGR